MQRAILIVASLLMSLGISSSPSLAEITGRASVVDGDTIEIRHERIRLFGIDAPEGKQRCYIKGKSWRCGQHSAFALADLIGRAWVRCIEKDRDRYGRIVAVCFLGQKNVNAWMVREGWAVAYRHFSRDYIAEERESSAAKRGLWQGEFIMPWDWRRGKRLAATQEQRQPQRRCLIKGNINRSGQRIYHVPGGEYYNRTRINTSKGERWFCTEAEAQAAGWRRSRR